MTDIARVNISSWDQPIAEDERQVAVRTLERGGVILLPSLPFGLHEGEHKLMDTPMSGKRKNVSFDSYSGKLGGIEADAPNQDELRALLGRYAAASRDLLLRLAPGYARGLQVARTSFRPVEIEGRSSSWRKDDTRLHVDSFPSSPTHGVRILRVFSNINPNGQSRRWRLGEPFENVARRFLPGIRPPVPGSSALMHWLHITKRRRTAYDHYMLNLHDTMKADLKYQAEVDQIVHEFEPGSTWLVYTDQASHAAMRGQHALEQTFHVAVDAMEEPAQSPLRVLERMLARPLV